jgi:hypothetical protein
LTGKQPNENIGSKIADNEYLPGLRFIEIKQSPSEKQKRNGIGNNMNAVSMDHWGGENPDKPMSGSRQNTKITEINVQKKLN